MDNIQEFFKKAVDTHLDFLKQTVAAGETPIPIWVMLFKNNTIDIVAVINDTNQSPQQKIGYMIMQKSPDAYVVFAEAYSKTVTKESFADYMKNKKYGDLENDPERKECLTVSGKSIDGKHKLERLFWIKRPDKYSIDFIEEDQTKLSDNLP